LARENLDENIPGGIFRAPNGLKFPSFLVMERGCSLAEWQQRQPLSFAASISMLYEVANLLQTMHRIGRAHRDVQPENILLMVQSHAWTFSDLGMTGTIGEPSLCSAVVVSLLNVVCTSWSVRARAVASAFV
jgi:serine/threonine protein kinase